MRPPRRAAPGGRGPGGALATRGLFWGCGCGGGGRCGARRPLVAARAGLLSDLGMDSLTFLATVVLVVPLCRSLRLSPTLGFLLGGLALDSLGLLRNEENVASLSELGVLFLLFEQASRGAGGGLSCMRPPAVTRVQPLAGATAQCALPATSLAPGSGAELRPAESAGQVRVRAGVAAGAGWGGVLSGAGGHHSLCVRSLFSLSFFSRARAQVVASTAAFTAFELPVGNALGTQARATNPPHTSSSPRVR